MLSTLTVAVGFDGILDPVMASEGIRGCLNGGRQPVAGQHQAAALLALLPAAAQWLAAATGARCSIDQAGRKVMFGGVNTAFTAHTGLAASAMAWRLMHLVFLGADAGRAAQCQRVADDLLGQLTAHVLVSGLSLSRPSQWY